MTEETYSVLPKKRLGILFCIIIGAILIATLWPFNIFPTNRVAWLDGINGIRFGGRGVVLSKTPLRGGAGGPGRSCSLELLLRPASVTGSDTVLGFSTPENPNQFMVKQWTDGLLVTHDILDSRNKPKKSKFDVDHAFQAGKSLLLTMTSGANGTIVYLNGRQASVFPRFVIAQDEFFGKIVLGTAPEDYQPWSGEVRGMAIYSKELTAEQVSGHYENWIAGSGAPDLEGAIAYYPFTEGAGREVRNLVVSGADLEIPNRFKVPHKPFLKSAVKEFAANWDYVNDVLRNIAGFIPLGFIACAYWAYTQNQNRAIVYAIFAGGMLSFVIEVMQFFVPQRNSGTTDVIANTLGAALGTLLARPSVVRTIFDRTRPTA